MRLLGISASPRPEGYSRRLLRAALEAAAATGAAVEELHAAELAVAPCRACDACREGGICAQADDMARVLPALARADALLLASPVYFFGPPAQLKALIDRCQPCWWNQQGRRAAGADRPRRPGYLLGIAAIDRPAVFEGLRLATRALFASLEFTLCGELLLTGLDGPGADARLGPALDQARDLGRRAALDSDERP